jgi:hypothetical protein
MEVEDLTVADDREFERNLNNARPRNLDVLEEAYNWWHEEESNASKRCRMISLRADQLRGS